MLPYRRKASRTTAFALYVFVSITTIAHCMKHLQDIVTVADDSTCEEMDTFKTSIINQFEVTGSASTYEPQLLLCMFHFP